MTIKIAKIKLGDRGRGVMQTASAALPLRRCPTIFAVLAFALLASLGGTAEAQSVQARWTGAIDQFWSTPGNWVSGTAPKDGDSIQWATATKNFTSFNDIPNLSLTEFFFNTANPITIGGESVRVTGTVGVSSGSPATNTINLPLELDRALVPFGQPANSQLIINGTISETGGSRGIIIGNNGVTSGTFFFNAANTFSGTVRVGGLFARASAVINTLGDIGVAQSLGTGSVIEFGGRNALGTLIYTGSATSTNKLFAIGPDFSNNESKPGGAFINDGSGAVVWTGTQVRQRQGTTDVQTFTLGGTNTADNDWQSAIGNNAAGSTNNNNNGTIGFIKTGTGKWILSGSNSYSGTTQVLAGTLRITNTNSLQNSPLSTSGSGTLQLGSGFTTLRLGGLTGSTSIATFITDGYSGTTTDLRLNTVAAGGTQSYTGDLANAAASSMALTKTGSGTQILGGVNSYTGDTTISAGTLRLGISGNSLPGNIANAARLELLQVGATTGFVNGLISGTGSVTMAGSGTVRLSNALNSYTGKTSVSEGTLEFASIGNVEGGASSLGAPTTLADGTIDLGSGTNAVGLRYVGSGTSTTNRVVSLAGSTGPVSIVSDGTGALVLSTALAASGAAKDFTLGGSSTANNEIGAIPSPVANVAKTGSGLWRLTAASSYAGQLSVLDGTIVVAANVNSSGNSPFGSQNGESFLPIIGSSAAGVTGTAGLLIEGSRTIDRGMSIAALGAGSSQAAVLGITGTGSATFADSITLGRGVTLQASNSGTVTFANDWVNAGDPVAFTIGSEGNAGVVLLESQLPTSTGVSIVRGTARLQVFSDDRIVPATPVTIGSGLGPATFDLNGQSQTLSSTLAFAGNSGSITGGTLRLNSAIPVSVSGTDHVIRSLVTLDAPASFNVNAASRLLVSSTISEAGGARSLTKMGAGILELTGTNNYSGPTNVDAGGLLVSGSNLGIGLVSVGSGGWIGGRGSLAGGLALSGSGAGLVFDPAFSLAGGLKVAGSVSIDNSFGVASLVGVDGLGINWNSIDDGTYMLIQTSSTFNSIQNFGPGNAADIGGGRSAYFQNGSLQLVIVPEPGALALVALGLAAAAWAYRRRSPRVLANTAEIGDVN